MVSGKVRNFALAFGTEVLPRQLKFRRQAKACNDAATTGSRKRLKIFSEKCEKNFGNSKNCRNFAAFFGASET